ncbi:MAG: hypothetical protein M0P70_04810 [Desulfobulbaceae bacterium]|nr:hypothetical protein [Desulfobulbaceae bacterium]
MDQSVSKYFNAALIYLLDQEGRGAQSHQAGQQKIDRGYIKAIIKGRKPGAEDVRAKIAAHFHLTYEDMLALGRRILENREDDILEGDSSVEQKKLIHDKAAETAGGVISSITEKIMKTVVVLESDSTCRDVLVDLIDAFHEAVITHNENLALRNRIKKMEVQIARLKKEAGL